MVSVSLAVWLTDCDPLYNGYTEDSGLCFTYFYNGSRPMRP